MGSRLGCEGVGERGIRMRWGGRDGKFVRMPYCGCGMLRISIFSIGFRICCIACATFQRRLVLSMDDDFMMVFKGLYIHLLI